MIFFRQFQPIHVYHFLMDSETFLTNQIPHCSCLCFYSFAYLDVHCTYLKKPKIFQAFSACLDITTHTLAVFTFHAFAQYAYLSSIQYLVQCQIDKDLLNNRLLNTKAEDHRLILADQQFQISEISQLNKIYISFHLVLCVSFRVKTLQLFLQLNKSIQVIQEVLDRCALQISRQVSLN